MHIRHTIERSDVTHAPEITPAPLRHHKTRLLCARMLLTVAIATTMWTPALRAQETVPLSISAHKSADVAQLLVNFVTTISRDEISAGRLAMTRATSPDVRAFAAKVVEAHTSNIAAWAKEVPTLSLTIPDSITPPMTAKEWPRAQPRQMV